MGEFCNCMCTEQCRYGKHGRAFDICRGYDVEGQEVLTAERRAAYRALWEQQRQGNTAPNVLARAPCVHRGELVREAGCNSCRGHVLLKIFQCQIYTECSIQKPLDGIGCCAICADYAPTRPSSIAHSNEAPD